MRKIRAKLFNLFMGVCVLCGMWICGPSVFADDAEAAALAAAHAAASAAAAATNPLDKALGGLVDGITALWWVLFPDVTAIAKGGIAMLSQMMGSHTSWLTKFDIGWIEPIHPCPFCGHSEPGKFRMINGMPYWQCANCRGIFNTSYKFDDTTSITWLPKLDEQGQKTPGYHHPIYMTCPVCEHKHTGTSDDIPEFTADALGHAMYRCLNATCRQPSREWAWKKASNGEVFNATATE
ncbi:MAG: hypothetical protein LBJ83_03595 [Oscillospiraceae bacterium]|nr:hypothetical protein [Oscillospiraceae bacterium]